MTNEFNMDDVIQDPGPLFVPYIELKLFDSTSGIHDFDQLHRRVKTWFDSKFPHVLWQVGRFDKESRNFVQSRIYFSSRELYVEFCQEFPEFLRGDK